MLFRSVPVATAKGHSFFISDIQMRSIFIGTTLLLFLIPALLGRKNKRQLFFTVIMIFFLLIAFGGYTTYITQFLMPLKIIKEPGMLMLFVVLPMILIAAESMHQFMHDKKKKTPAMEKTFLAIQLFLVALVIIGIVGDFFVKTGIFRNLHAISAAEIGRAHV